MSQWAVYDSDGRIDRIYFGPKFEALMQLLEGEGVTSMPDGLNDSTAYVLDGQAIGKEPFSLGTTNLQIQADGTDEAVISNIPAGVTVQWPDGQVDEVTDGEVCFAVDLPGTYTLTFDAVPYLRQEVTIEAVAAT